MRRRFYPSAYSILPAYTALPITRLEPNSRHSPCLLNYAWRRADQVGFRCRFYGATLTCPCGPQIRHAGRNGFRRRCHIADTPTPEGATLTCLFGPHQTHMQIYPRAERGAAARSRPVTWQRLRTAAYCAGQYRKHLLFFGQFTAYSLSSAAKGRDPRSCARRVPPQ